jgi:hypothetical protein
MSVLCPLSLSSIARMASDPYAGAPDPDEALKSIAEALADLLQVSPREVLGLGIRPAVSEASRPNDVDAHLTRVQRLLSDPALRGALRTVRETPQAWEGVINLVRQRGEELRDAASVPGDLHRELTPLLAGILLTPRARAVFKLALDRAAQRESDELVRRATEGRNYSRQAIIGAGWHGAVLASEMLLREPGLDTISIEARDFLGGQFARTSGDVHTLNSRTRPERPDLENLPGTRGSLNPMGMAPLQQSDVETAAYGSQARLGDVIAVNQWLASPTMLGQEVMFIRTADDDPSRIEITCKDRRTGARITTTHDRVVLTSGLGEVDTGFASIDEETAGILASEAAKPLSERRVLGYDDHIALTGDSDNRFPLQGWKEVAVIGPGDGGRIAIGKLTGHETDNRLSVPNLDWVESIGWYGEQADTFREFVQQERTRYARIGLEMPRPEVDRNYYSRVAAINGKASGLREELGEDGLPTGRIVVRDNFGRGRAYDHVILAPGFIDRTMQVLSTLDATVYDSVATARDEREALTKPGTLVTGDFGRWTIDRVVPGIDGVDLLEVAREAADGGVRYDRVTADAWADELDASATLITGVEIPQAVSMTALTCDLLPPPRVLRTPRAMLADVDGLMQRQGTRFIDGAGEDMTMASTEQARAAILDGSVAAIELPANRSAAMRSVMRYPVGMRCSDAEVYLGGPAAKLPLSTTERNQVPALARIPANTASGFRYVARDELLGGMLAAADLAAPDAVAPEDRCLRDRGSAVVLARDLAGVTAASTRRLSVDGRDKGSARVVAISGVTGDRIAELPAGAEWDDMVKLAVSEADEIAALSGGRGADTATVSWRRDGEGTRAWTARVKGVAPKRTSAFDLLLGDPVLTRMADQTIDHAGPDGIAELLIPFEGSSVDLQRVSMSSRRTRGADREL